MPTRLSVAMSDNARSRPVLTGAVAIGGFGGEATVAHPTDIFWRQLKSAEFDVSEMSISSLAIVREQGRDDFVALPIFPVRRFFHTGLLVRTGAGINSPADLRGKRVGVPEYQQTAAVWVRGYLADEHGVRPEDLHWFMERGADASHAGAADVALPSGLSLRHIANGESIASLLESGELDAAIHYIPVRTGLDRSSKGADQLQGVHRLFADQHGEAARYFGLRGVLPMNHCVVIRRSLVEDDPAVIGAVFDAFARAAELAGKDFDTDLSLWLSGTGDPGLESVLRRTHPYGIEPVVNRTTLETLARYLQEQELVTTRFDVEKFFVGVGC